MVAVEDAFRVVEKLDPGVVQGPARGVSRSSQTMSGLGPDHAQGVQGPSLIMLYIKGYTPKRSGSCSPTWPSWGSWNSPYEGKKRAGFGHFPTPMPIHRKKKQDCLFRPPLNAPDIAQNYFNKGVAWEYAPWRGK